LSAIGAGGLEPPPPPPQADTNRAIAIAMSQFLLCILSPKKIPKHSKCNTFGAALVWAT